MTELEIARELGDKSRVAALLRDELQARPNPRLDGPARHVRIGSWRDDLDDLIEDVAANPASYGLACGLGFVAGLFVTVGLAEIWSLFL